VADCDPHSLLPKKQSSPIVGTPQIGFREEAAGQSLVAGTTNNHHMESKVHSQVSLHEARPSSLYLKLALHQAGMLLLPQQSLLMTLSGLSQLTIQLSKLLVSICQDLATPVLFHFGVCSNMQWLLDRQCRLLGQSCAPLLCKAAANFWHTAAAVNSWHTAAAVNSWHTAAAVKSCFQLIRQEQGRTAL